MPQRYAKIAHQLYIPWWAFEITIWLGLALTFSYHVYGHIYGGPLILRVLSGIAGLVLVYGSFIEPRFITVKKYEVGNGNRTVTIVFLSDLHAGVYKRERWFKKLTARTNALGADLILLGGDYLFDRASDAPLLAPLSELKAPLGVFAMLGNHDDYYGSKETVGQFEAMKIPLLVNSSIRIAGKGLTIVGLEDDWYADARFDAATQGVDTDDALILLSHNPELAVNGLKDMPRKPALILSGHDHGGQIRLPLIGSIWPMPHFLGRKFDRGIFDIGAPLIIGQGVGESGPRARLFCPPQIVLITLKY